jgi:hypothetical protein
MNELMHIKEFNKKYDLSGINLNKYYSGRTKFQLEHFVQKEHDCPERQFLQLIMELKSLRDGWYIDTLEMKKLEIQIERLLATKDDIDQIEALKKEYTLATLKEAMEHREREIKNIVDALRKLPKAYTYEEIENAESAYWEKRLARQATEDMMSAQTGINPGNIRSIIQANTSLKNSFLQFQQSLLDSMYSSKRQVLTEVPEQKLL